MDDKIISFLREKRIVGPNHTEWVVTFPDGRQVVINDLIKEFHQARVDNAEELGQAIDRVENLQYALDIPMPADFHLTQFKSLLPDVVKELKAGYVAVTGENPWE